MNDNTKAPVAFFWIDMETDRLFPDFKDGVLDLRPLNVMEVGIIVTDFDLRPLCAYQEAVKMTHEMAEGLRANDYIREMHQQSGLIKACIASPHDLASIEDEIIQMLKEETALTEGELWVAGSGTARFDQTIIQAKMPRLARWMHYAPADFDALPADVGVMRRLTKTFAQGDVVNVPKSYKDGEKLHRAYDDIEAHLEEGRRFRDFIRYAVELGAHNVPVREDS